MASNETVENMTDEIKSLGGRLHARAVLTAEEIHNLSHALETKAEKILAAHKREMAAKDDNRLTVVANYESVISAKDAEIEKLKFETMRLKSGQRAAGEVIIEQTNKVSAKDAEIEKIRALVKELADALKKIDDACDGDMCKHFIDTEQCSKCKYLETCQTGIAHNALKTNESKIAKALEVCGA